MLFRRGRLSIGSKQGDVTLSYQPFCDGEVLMGKASAPSRIYGLIAVNEFVQGLRRGGCVVASGTRSAPPGGPKELKDRGHPPGDMRAMSLV